MTQTATDLSHRMTSAAITPSVGISFFTVPDSTLGGLGLELDIADQ